MTMVTTRETDSRIYPGLERKPGGPDNWVEAAGGLPDYIERIAKHLHYEQGYDIARAIATAVNTVKRWARGGPAVEGGEGHVTAKTQALAAKALAEWEAKKASVKMAAVDEFSFELATPTAAMRKSALKQGAALPPAAGSGDGSARFPLTSRDLASKAVKMVQLAKGDKNKIRRFIMATLRSKGWADLIPSNWQPDGSVGTSGAGKTAAGSSKPPFAMSHTGDFEFARYVATAEGARFYGVPVGSLITQKGAQQRVKDTLNPGLKLAPPKTALLDQGEKEEFKIAMEAVRNELRRLKGSGTYSQTVKGYQTRIEQAQAKGDYSGVVFELRSILASGELTDEDKVYYRTLLNKALRGQQPKVTPREVNK
jgi:hypothetical protein